MNKVNRIKRDALLQSYYVSCFVSLILILSIASVPGLSYSIARSDLVSGWSGEWSKSIEDKYDEHGKWMDGWESKRRRDGGNDWAIIKLGSPGIISEINVDTSFFTGNFPPFASIEGLYSEQKPSKDSDWIEILSKTSLKGDSSNKFKIESKTKINYIKLQIFPDGGVARLRLFGEVKLNWDNYDNKNDLIELSSLKLGGSIVAYNNAHYGDVSALLSDGRG